MTRALIGFTGFVGSNLQRQISFDAVFNRANIAALSGSFFDEVVCSAAPAEKWRANKFPDEDLRNIETLVGAIHGLSCQRFILISTIDVYPVPRAVDETADIGEGSHAYGRNRRLLERAIAENFAATIIRLPALFGPGLKKNAIYDLLNDNLVDRIHPHDEYQFYNIERLWTDIRRAIAAELPLVNIVSKPIEMKTIASSIFARELAWPQDREPVSYDVRSVYSNLWGRGDGYMQGQHEVLSEVRSFVEQARSS